MDRNVYKIMIPYHLTMMGDDYRKLVFQEFNHENILSLINTDWHEVDMGSWVSYKNKLNKNIIEFVDKGVGYKITNYGNNQTYELPYPQTINDLISDCYRIGIELKWNKEAVSEISRIQLMKQGDIETHVNDLLVAVGKD